MQKAMELYLAWLIPSSVSFLCSVFLLYYILVRHKKLRNQLFHQLTVFLAAADLIQSGNWFIGAKYTAPYSQCAVQEYMLQAGTLFKAFTTIIICGLATYIVSQQKHPNQIAVLQYGAIVLLIPCLAVVLSISLHSAKLFCNVHIDKYSDASRDERISILAFWLCFEVLVYICALVDVTFLCTIDRRLKAIHSSLTSTSRAISVDDGSSLHTKRQLQLIQFVNRLRFYPLVFVVCWVPDSISLLVILLTGRHALTLRLIANAAGGSTGWAIALSYFYFQYNTPSRTLSTIKSTSSSGGSGADSRTHVLSVEVNDSGISDVDNGDAKRSTTFTTANRLQYQEC
mmetsp:Transcript_5590/g.8517  ORF Transcript_5590/g.8517 Transcript_5590/m.8517 type:complete len:342 (-) Transcript_5590:185-1210(-)